MRIRGKKPWALIDGKIARFSSHQEFAAWSDNDLRQRLDRMNKLDALEFRTPKEVLVHLEESDRKRRTLAQVSRRGLKRVGV